MNAHIEEGLNLPRKTLFALGGFVAGLVVTNVFSLLFLSLFGATIGEFIVPLALTMVLGILAAKWQLQFGVAMMAGALVETLFFIWLFHEFSRGLDF